MMAFCERMYLPSDAKVAEINKASSRNNIVLIPYSILKEAKGFKDASSLKYCRGCGAALTCLSQLLSKDEYNARLENEDFPDLGLDDEQKAREENEANFVKGKFFKDLSSDEKGWICEYCDVHNRVPANTVVPEAEDNVYVLQKNTMTKKQEETKTSDSTKEFYPEDETNLIFAIDVSGSMGEKYTVSDDGKTVQRKRLELISDAILKQLEPMREKYPNRKVGFVLFNNRVTLRGDCKNGEVVMTADLENFQKTLNYSELKGEGLLKEKLQDSLEYLKSALRSLAATGGTALGPGLLCSLGLAMKGGAGSRIFLCTDGLANVGLGRLESVDSVTLQKSQDFYQQVGNIAVENGVSISIITVKGNACKVDALGPLTDQTAGTITRVDPADLDLSEIAANNLVARDVNLKVILHEALSFQNEESSNLQNNNTIMVKKVGSVSESNEVYFEYKVKSLEELQKERMSLEQMTWIPLQSQITFTDMQGNVCVRVICKKQELTKDQKEVHKAMKTDVLAGYVEKQSANLVLNGRIQEAEKHNQGWGEMMDEIAENDDIEESTKLAMKEMKKQQKETHQLIQQSNTIQLYGGNQVEKDEIASTWFSKKQQKKK